MNTANIVSMFSYNFMQFAMIVGLILGICLPIVGVIVYLRKIIFLSDTIGQISLTGASFGVFISSIVSNLVVNNFWMIIIFTIIGAIFIQFLIDKIKVNQEISLLITHSIAISLVMILLSLTKNYGANLFNILFGNINSISAQDVMIIACLSIMVISLLLAKWRTIILVFVDEVSAKLRGINVTFYKYFTTILISVMIALAVKVIGVLLVATMLALPIVSASLVSRNLKQVVLMSIVMAIISFEGGIMASYLFDLPASALIVFVSLLELFISGIIKIIRGRSYGK